jgi:hypothetical protein
MDRSIWLSSKEPILLLASRRAVKAPAILYSYSLAVGAAAFGFSNHATFG